jgi:hypothetical protein
MFNVGDSQEGFISWRSSVSVGETVWVCGDLVRKKKRSAWFVGFVPSCYHPLTPRTLSSAEVGCPPQKTQLLIWIVPHLAHLEWIGCSFTFVTVLEGADMENQSERSHSLTHACPNSTEGDGEGGGRSKKHPRARWGEEISGYIPALTFVSHVTSFTAFLSSWWHIEM